jgi:Predicted membrane protein (DUF2339)
VLFSVWPQAAPLATPALVQFSANGLIYFDCSYSVLERGYHAWLGLFAVVLAAAYVQAARRLRARDPRGAQLFAGLAGVFVVLAVPVQFAGYRITIGWAVEAAALAWIVRRMSEPRAMQASLGVFALVLVRLLAGETWMYAAPTGYPLLANARFLTFVVSAVCLWAAARFAAAKCPALATLLGGHFVILWGLGLEVAAWATRTAAPADWRSVESIALSILLAAYAVLLIGIGVAANSTPHRLLGLGLIAAVVAKLYVYDVWFLGLFYRMAAFAALGVLLLVMSFAGERRRPRGSAYALPLRMMRYARSVI